MLKLCKMLRYHGIISIEINFYSAWCPDKAIVRAYLRVERSPVRRTVLLTYFNLSNKNMHCEKYSQCIFLLSKIKCVSTNRCPYNTAQHNMR